MLTFHLRSFVVLVAFCAVVLAGVTVGVRWTCNRVEGAIYARKELDHAFEAANFRRAARRAEADPESFAKVASLKRLAQQHERASRECARLRELYETSW